MTFKESYLIPKELYEKLLNSKKNDLLAPIGVDLPADVKVRMMDFHERFKENPTIRDDKHDKRKERSSGTHEQIEQILGSVNNQSKLPLASEIIEFIRNKMGGTVTWDRNYNLVLNGTTFYGVDIRDCLRVLLGDLPVSTVPVDDLVKYLRAFDIDERMLMYYKEDDESDEDDTTIGIKKHKDEEEEEEDEEELEDLDKSFPQPKKQDNLYMHLRSGKIKGWEKY